jgi:hypothetical protein
MKPNAKLCLMVALGALSVTQAYAGPCSVGPPPSNCDPPAGNVILDLNSTPIPHTYTLYSVVFTAAAGVNNISFAFREDPAFLSLDDVTLTGPGSPTILNGGFELGPVGSNTPVDWTYLNLFGAGAAGVVNNNNPHSGSNNYYDGAVQAYDAITQAVTLTGGSYTLSFWLDDNSGNTTFSRLSTNGNVTNTGGNGIDLIVYAGAIPTAAAPEPTTFALLGLGMLGAVIVRRRRA